MYRPASLALLQDMDIYLIDQILKGRYIPGQHILDAGTGAGRNLNWFLHEDFQVSACDRVAEREDVLKARYPRSKVHWSTCDVSKMPYPNAQFDHVICNAVLHFADDTEHFHGMWNELIRVLRPKGSLFIRMTSDIGIAKKVESLGHGRHLLPDGSERFLLTNALWSQLKSKDEVDEVEPMKSVNVADQRVMSTLVLVKKVLE